jgi:hypothetical protein
VYPHVTPNIDEGAAKREAKTMQRDICRPYLGDSAKIQSHIGGKSNTPRCRIKVNGAPSRQKGHRRRGWYTGRSDWKRLALSDQGKVTIIAKRFDLRQ